MGSYVENNIFNGEEVIFETNYHWVHFFSLSSFFTLGIYPIIQNNFDEYVITNRRIIVKKGLFSINTLEMSLNRIETVNVQQSILGRIFGYGNITIIGTGGTKETFKKLQNPLDFRRHFMTQV